MKQMKWVIVLMVGLIPLLISCASIITGTSQQVSIKSDPSGAKFTVDPGGLQGTTPSVVTLPKGKGYTVTAVKEGYEKATQSIGTSFNGWFFGNLFIGWIIGMIIDVADGAYMNLDRESVYFILEPKK